MKKIGLTGGIGSGKSMVASILRHMGYPVYISDREASRLMEDDEDIRSGLTAHFGKDIYAEDGRLNRPLLAGIIFHDKGKLLQTNSIVHPRVMQDFGQWAGLQTAGPVFFESAVLFEAGLDRYFFKVISVTATEETRLKRVMYRDKAAEEAVKARIRSQLDEEEKCRKADYLIRNDEGSMIIPQILDILHDLEITE